MKSNNKSLKENKFDFLSFLKPCLIATLIIVFIAGLFWGIFGFNKGFDYTGGTQLVVDFTGNNTIQTEEGLNKTSSQIREILKNNGVDVNSMQVQGEYYEKSLVITFQSTDIDTVRNIRLEINEKFNSTDTYVSLPDDQKEKILDDESVNAFDITKQTTTVDGLISPTALITTIATLIFALIIAMLYALIRFKTAGALTLTFGGFFGVILTVAFVLIARIQINTYFLGVLGLVLFANVYSSADFLFSIKQKTKDPMLTDKTNHDLANLVVSENLKKTIVVYASALVVTLVLGIFGVLNVLQLALVAFIGLAVSAASHIFVVPAFWASINKKRELSRPTAIINNEDKDAEVVEVEENNEDENAEVVEVND